MSLLTACGTDPGVATQSAERLVTPTPTTAPSPPPTTDAGPPPTTDDVPATTDVVPPSTDQAPPTTTAQGPATTVPGGSLGDRLDEGDAKPARDYDEFVRLALNDIERWWAGEFPAIYGQPFEPLAGGVYAAYPERTTPIPGCETDAPTEYQEIAQYSAFYCMDGDFMVYDDGPNGVLAGLAGEFGPSILGVVFAHEFGHAIQARAGVLDRDDLATIDSEQQADCFAGAWVAHVRDGGAEGITFTDQDVRSGLVAMITVRDPIGIDTFDAGGHGSAFDRVGAFQTGFTAGAGALRRARRRSAAARAEHVPARRSAGDGNADFGYADREVLELHPRRPAGVLGRRGRRGRRHDADVDARAGPVAGRGRVRRSRRVVRHRRALLPGHPAGVPRRAAGTRPLRPLRRLRRRLRGRRRVERGRPDGARQLARPARPASSPTTA